MSFLARFLARRAAGAMKRPPDFVIGENYMQRWHLVPRNPLCNVYVHRYTGSDDDRALHDHPWPSWSLLIEGTLRERYRPGGNPHDERERIIEAGRWTWRSPRFTHRLELESEGAVTVFITGPKVRAWGFYCPDGGGYRWVHWKQFTDPSDSGKVGRGCG